MRISADPKDRAFCDTGLWKVTVDGRETRGCVTADEEKGFVLLLAVNDQGNCYANNVTGEMVSFEYHGVVKIREKTEWRDG